MKKSMLKYLGYILVIQALFAACSPDDYTYHDNSIIDVSAIDCVVLQPNHVMVLADGHACLDLYPRMFTKDKDSIPDSRVTEDMLEYTSSSGMALTRYFKTSDASLVGKTLDVQVKIKGTDVVSNSATFRVVAPLEDKYTSEITIPVVFHIVQTAKEIESYGGKYDSDLIAMHLKKLNNLFGGVVSENPVGVNTHIRFELALYTPYGQKMNEPGVNRYTPQAIDIADNYAGFLEKASLIWPGDKYMNVWLISDLKDDIKDFANDITDNCGPVYVYAGTPEDGRPEGIKWVEYAEGTTFAPKEIGILYKLQELDNPNRKFANNMNKSSMNELAYYVGRYLGLFPTYSYGTKSVTDYCEDTQDYSGEQGAISEKNGWNASLYKHANGCYFRAENIADDPRGLHIAVSKEQCKRMRWVLENSPQRAAWKSEYALKGK